LTNTLYYLVTNMGMSNPDQVVQSLQALLMREAKTAKNGTFTSLGAAQTAAQVQSTMQKLGYTQSQPYKAQLAAQNSAEAGQQFNMSKVGAQTSQDLWKSRKARQVAQTKTGIAASRVAGAAAGVASSWLKPLEKALGLSSGTVSIIEALVGDKVITGGASWLRNLAKGKGGDAGAAADDAGATALEDTGGAAAEDAAVGGSILEGSVVPGLIISAMAKVGSDVLSNYAKKHPKSFITKKILDNISDQTIEKKLQPVAKAVKNALNGPSVENQVATDLGHWLYTDPNNFLNSLFSSGGKAKPTASAVFSKGAITVTIQGNVDSKESAVTLAAETAKAVAEAIEQKMVHK
jgi:hypothetical protein